MEINKPLKSENLILLNARKAVVVTFIIFVIYTFGSVYLLSYKIINYSDYNTIFTLLLIIHAIFCGRLYNAMSKNIILSLIMGILIVVLNWFALGIGTFLLTIYLLVTSNTALKKLDLNLAIPSEKITSLVSTEENKTPITEEVFRQESKAKKDLDYDEAYKKALYFIDKEEYDKALLYLEVAIKTDIISLKGKAYVNIGLCYGNLGNHAKAIDAFKQAIRIDPEYATAYYNLGTAYNSLSLYRDAIDAFKQAIRIDPDHNSAHFSLGFSYFKTGDKSSALDEYKILKELDIDLANKLFDLIYWYKGNLNEILKHKEGTRLNKKQRLVLAIFIPIIILFITLVIANSVGYTVITREVPESMSMFRKYIGTTTTIYKGNPFDWGRTWYVWVIYFVFCCIFEYKLFADKKER